MLKKNRFWVIFSVVFWLFCCQGLFAFVQRISGEKTVTAVQNQLRQELNFSDFHYLARSIIDYTNSGAIKCAVLEKIKPEFIAVTDLKYMEKSCDSNSLLLDGSLFDVELKTLNGDIYRLSFISINSYFFYLALWGFRILGIILALSVIFAIVFRAQKDLLQVQLELDFANKVKDIAFQVSHDIRSPLAALNMAIEDIHIENFQSKNIIINALGRIDEIANYLLGNDFNAKVIVTKNELLEQIIESIVSEKQIEFKKVKNIQIEFIPLKHQQSGEIQAELNQVEFKRIISNLINNSVEAIPEERMGLVSISLALNGMNYIDIVVNDNGKGIPANILSRVGEKGFSHDKEKSIRSGTGLGINHAKEMIEKFGGKFELSSVAEKGSLIKMSLPISFRQQSNQEHYDYVLIDNDELVRLTWEAKANKKNFKLLALRSTIEFTEYENKMSKDVTKIYLDSELGNGELAGEKFAEQLYERGYKNLTIATGHPKEKFAHLTWLKHSGKSTPF